MGIELAQLLREAARMHDDAEISASRKGHVRNAEHHYRRSLACKAEAASLEALSVNVANLRELVRVQHEALEEIANPCNANDLDGGPAIARAALAKYNEIMGEGNEQ